MSSIRSAPVRLAWLWPLAVCFGIGTACAVLIVVIANSPRGARVRTLCDEQVAALLHSNDLVDVTRAGIIVRHMDCSIGSRL